MADEPARSESWWATIEAYEMCGSNDLGDFRGPFEKIRSVEFVR